MVLRYALSLLPVFLLVQSLNAQPHLQFHRVEVRYPTIRLAFKVSCDGQFRNDIEPEHYEVYENGIKVKDATLWCPPEVDCCVSVALVFDRSGSMAGEKIELVRIGGMAFVASMNPDGIPCDEAAVISFAEDVTTDVSMTSSKPALLNAINSIEAWGWTALWDATAVGIQELVANGKNRCKAVIVLSDGGDNRSQYFKNVQSVIALAQSQNVKVFTIGYGIPQGGVEELNLQRLSQETGAEYYFSADGTDIEQIYASIKESIKESYKECIIEYESDCPDGSMRTVELRLKNFCGGNAIATRTYIAPLDRSVFKPVTLRVGDAEVGATKEVVVPVLLQSPVNEVFSKANFIVAFDRNVLQLLRISTDGTLLEGRPIRYQQIGSGVQIFLDEHMQMNELGGVLVYLHFRAGDVANTVNSLLMLLNWNFEAYCLYPLMYHGTVKIRPREPELHCEIIAPDALNWNDVEKRYEPNPFTVTVVVYNTGTKEAWNVRAHLVVDESVVTLVSPTNPQQELSPRIIQPGSSAMAHWTLLADKQEDLDSIGVYFSVSADNYPMFACWQRIVIDPALNSALACEIEAPDTVYFREQFYEPEEFDITVRAINIGSGQTQDVRAQLLQDTRFAIVPPASKILADVLLPTESAEETFRVRINPRTTDGYDTLRINIQGDDTNPAWCYHPVWVQRVRMPEFVLQCEAEPDSLVFSDDTYEYIPNPFNVSTFTENIGETYAEDCQIMFVGPEFFTPVGTNLRSLGTMQVGDRHTEHWTIRALPRVTAGWDTLHFQVTGRGGLGKQIVLAECFVPVYVPAVRRPAYTMECSAPDSLVYIDNQYQPQPVFTLRIRNVGTATGRGLNPTLILPPLLSLAPGERAEKYISSLAVGEFIDIEWKLHPEMRSYDGDYRLCAIVIDSIGESDQCCTDIYIPKTENPILLPTCWSVDSLYIDSQTGSYLGNPFDVVLNLTNAGIGVAENVRVSISVLGSFMQVLDPPEQALGIIEAGQSTRVVWQVEALKRPVSESVPILITVTADNHGDAECDLSVFVPAAESPFLTTQCSSTPEDSLFFDWNTGDFEHSICTLRFEVRNTGTVTAMNVDALLIVPSGVTLSGNESPQKRLDPPNLEPGQSAVVTWTFQALRSDDNVIRHFRFIARCDNADDAVCVDSLFVQGSPRYATVTLPAYVLMRYGQKKEIPISIDRTIGKDLSEYLLHLDFDPTVIRVLGISNARTLTAIGWVGAKYRHVSPGRIEISDYTTGSPLATESGVLLYLTVEGIYDAEGDIADFGETTLRLDPSTALMNRGIIQVLTVNGSAIVTNPCLEPLLAAEPVVLEQNRPNPFNPQTTIFFSLRQEQSVRLTVLDVHGRVVSTLVDRTLPAGKHQFVFDAEHLPSGMYLYRLESPGHVQTRKMIFAR